MELRRAEFLPHMPLTGVSGMDVYAGTGAASRFIGSVKPAGAQDIRYEGVLALRGGGPSPEIASVVYPLPDREGLTDITVNFPLYKMCIRDSLTRALAADIGRYLALIHIERKTGELLS